MKLNEFDQSLIRLHEAANGRELSAAIFRLVQFEVPSLAQFLTLRPIYFELPSYSSDPKFQRAFDRYISGGHKNDIWMRRGPINPNVRVLRHSNHTPLHILKRSTFYRDVMRVGGAEYGASLVAWHGDEWLATLTVFRTPEQGDFSDLEVAVLERLQYHFGSAIKRVAQALEARQGTNSLEVFIWNLPTAAMILSWNLQMLHYNAQARELAFLWRFGAKARDMSNPKTVVMPGDILEQIRRRRENIPEVSPTRYNRPKIFPLISIAHQSIQGFSAEISFLPSRALSISRGTFLISMRHLPVPKIKKSYDFLSKLSRREQKIFELVLRGMTGSEISREFKTRHGTVRVQLHNIYRKLAVRSRSELMALVMGSQSL